MTPYRTRLPLTALRAFDAAARHLSFKAAAEELGVTPASISNQIRQLERDWSCRLFVRLTRRVELTPDGLALAQVVGPSLDGLQAGLAGLPFVARSGGALPQRQITLAVGPLFGTRWLTPRLGHWYTQHPHTALVLRHGEPITRAQQLSSVGAIDWGMGDWPELDALRLFDCWFAPVASPALLAARGGLATPADLARYPLLHQLDRQDWTHWLTHAGVPNLRPLHDTVMADANMAMQAAIDGQGVALGVFPLVQADVDAGRLVCPFALRVASPATYYLLTSPAARGEAQVQMLRSWMTSNI